MAIITISRGCFSHGKEIAERVAARLDYECVSEEILFEASQFFNVPEMKLLKSIHDAPTLLERITHEREKYLSYIQAALLEHVKTDNVVYHGHAGHLLLPRISHVLRVRVIAEMEQRIAFLQEKQDLSRDEAIVFINKEDKERAHWTRYIYKVEMEDPRLYDIVTHIERLNVQDACEIICCAAQSDRYKANLESKRAMNDLALSSHVKATIQGICEAEVTSTEGVVRIRVKGQRLKKTGFARPELQQQVRERIREDLAKEIVGIVSKIPGVDEVICDIDLPYYY